MDKLLLTVVFTSSLLLEVSVAQCSGILSHFDTSRFESLLVTWIANNESVGYSITAPASSTNYVMIGFTTSNELNENTILDAVFAGNNGEFLQEMSFVDDRWVNGTTVEHDLQQDLTQTSTTFLTSSIIARFTRLIDSTDPNKQDINLSSPHYIAWGYNGMINSFNTVPVNLSIPPPQTGIFDTQITIPQNCSGTYNFSTSFSTAFSTFAAFTSGTSTTDDAMYITTTSTSTPTSSGTTENISGTATTSTRDDAMYTTSTSTSTPTSSGTTENISGTATTSTTDDAMYTTTTSTSIPTSSGTGIPTPTITSFDITTLVIALAIPLGVITLIAIVAIGFLIGHCVKSRRHKEQDIAMHDDQELATNESYGQVTLERINLDIDTQSNSAYGVAPVDLQEPSSYSYIEMS